LVLPGREGNILKESRRFDRGMTRASPVEWRPRPPEKCVDERPVILTLPGRHLRQVASPKMKQGADNFLWWTGIAILVVIIVLELIHVYNVGMW
jgi:hypothetical protein